MVWCSFENDGDNWPLRLIIIGVLFVVLIAQWIWINHTPDDEEPEEDSLENMGADIRNQMLQA